MKAYGLSSFASVPATGSLRQPSSSSQSSPSAAKSGSLDLDPGAVAEIAVLARDRQLEQRPHEEALAGLALQDGQVVADPRALLALVLVEQEDRLRQAHANVARLARVRLATDLAGEGHYAAPGKYCCQTCGIVGVARWMKSTGAGGRGWRCR